MISNKIRLSLVVCTACFLGANAASAGEVNGNGDVVPGGVNGRSACSFSGLEDHPVDPGTTQSWGTIVKDLPAATVAFFVRVLGFNPGSACNPTND